MTNHQRQNEFPSIRLDDLDRLSSSAAKSAGDATTDNLPEKASSGTAGLWLVLLLMMLLSGGSLYYLWMVNQQQQETLTAAEQRIASLENKLSATGEEMGESTVALQVKVTELNERTNELWKEMDKLWASAWRRNQKEITDLKEASEAFEKSTKKALDDIRNRLQSVVEKTSTQEGQMASLADEILSLNVQIEQLSTTTKSQADSIKKVTSTLATLEQRNTALSNNISSLEKEIRALATKTVTSNATSG